MIVCVQSFVPSFVRSLFSFFLRELSGLFTLTFINYSCNVAGRRRSNEEGGSVSVAVVGQKCTESLCSPSPFGSLALSLTPSFAANYI